MSRQAHLEQFDQLSGRLAVLSREVCVTVRRANVALLDVQPVLARAVLAEVAERAEAHREIDELVPLMVARRQPVASDLRLVVAALRINSDLHRMGALTGHVAQIAAARHPSPAVPPEVRPVLGAMADAAARLAEKSALVLATRDPIDAIQTGLDDDEPDALQRALFVALSDDWPHGIQAAIDVAMLGRYYERLADHAVAVARQVAYLVLGGAPQGRP